MSQIVIFEYFSGIFGAGRDFVFSEGKPGSLVVLPKELSWKLWLSQQPVQKRFAS